MDTSNLLEEVLNDPSILTRATCPRAAPVRFRCAHCGAFRSLRVNAHGLFSKTKKERCHECGSTFLEPYTAHAVSCDAQRDVNVKSTRGVGKHRPAQRKIS